MSSGREEREVLQVEDVREPSGELLGTAGPRETRRQLVTVVFLECFTTDLGMFATEGP